jgi:hypothetical protein
MRKSFFVSKKNCSENFIKFLSRKNIKFLSFLLNGSKLSVIKIKFIDRLLIYSKKKERKNLEEKIKTKRENTNKPELHINPIN